MGATSPWHLIILLVIVLLLFGTGKISSLMGDVAKGIKSFKKGMAEDDDPAKKPGEEAKADGKTIEHAAGQGAAAASTDKSKVG
jgi:sec-independent protein translocase protein TatA